VLETRKVNKKAVAFYLAKGYKVIENFGKYRGREEAVCFEKRIKRL
jgi:ribosomal protein S18 acetylase RimI-like enzyme